MERMYPREAALAINSLAKGYREELPTLFRTSKRLILVYFLCSSRYMDVSHERIDNGYAAPSHFVKPE
jgi:hypothetical protein